MTCKYISTVFVYTVAVTMRRERWERGRKCYQRRKVTRQQAEDRERREGGRERRQ